MFLAMMYSTSPTAYKPYNHISISFLSNAWYNDCKHVRRVRCACRNRLPMQCTLDAHLNIDFKIFKDSIPVFNVMFTLCVSASIMTVSVLFTLENIVCRNNQISSSF